MGEVEILRISKHDLFWGKFLFLFESGPGVRSKHNLEGRIGVDFFERQLHIAVLVAVIEVVTCIVHRQKIDQVDTVVGVVVFQVMGEQRREFAQLVQRAVQEEKGD